MTDRHIQAFDLQFGAASRLLNQAGYFLNGQPQFKEAEPLYRRALAIDEQSYGAEHPAVARDLNNLAQLLKAANRLAEAEPLMRRAVEILDEFTRRTGFEHPNAAAVRRKLEAMKS